MLIVLSPAKAMNFDPGPTELTTQPALRADTKSLSRTARALRASDLKRMMDLSDQLAKLNRERFRAFDPDSEDGLQAAFAFNGDVYQGLKARELNASALAYAQEHVRILSGLYGLLRPLDRIQPYRLEMGVRIKTRRGESLYDFWGSRIAKALKADADALAEPVIVNCASQEYFGAVDRKALKLPVITCHFREVKEGEPTIVSFFAKRARGTMARYAIDHRIERAEDLKGFGVGGYAYSAQLSGETDWTFVRPFVTMADRRS